MDRDDLKERFSYGVTGLCIWVIKLLNREKDRCLSQRLFKVAERYNTRPNTFNYWSPDIDSDGYYGTSRKD